MGYGALIFTTVMSLSKRYSRDRGEFEELRRNLEKMVEERTAQLSSINAQLRREVAESRRAEEWLAARNRVLEQLATGATLEEVLSTLVKTAEELHPGLLTSALILDNERKRLLHGAAPSLPDFYNQAVDGLEIGPGVGSCGTAAFTGKRVIVTDVMTHPYWADFRELAEMAGLRACWSEPIVSSAGQVLGTLATYYRELREPEPLELEFMTAAARLAAIAIERKHMESALVESEERVRQIAENVGEVFFLSDAQDHHAVYVSPAYSQIWGRPVETVYANAQSWQDAVHPEDRERVKAVLDGHERGRRPFSHEYRIVRPDGSIRWISDRVSPVRDEAGHVYRVAGVSQDITQRRRAEEALRQSDARYHELFESIMEGIGLVDEYEVVQFCNPALVNILEEESVGDLIGKSLLDYVVPDHLETVSHQTGLRRKNISSRYEVDIITKKKNRKTVLASVAPRFDEKGAYVGAFGAIIDITDRKRAEEEARHHQEALTRVSRLTTMGEMASALAHELNQPLCAIAGYAQASVRMLASGESDEKKLLETMDKAGVQARRAGDIVNRIKGFVGKGELVRRTANVNDIVHEAGTLASLLASRQHSSLRFELADHLPPIEADELQLEQVIVNLIMNGLEAMEETKPAERELVVLTSRADSGGIEVAVRDNGRGLDPDTRDRVFEPFFTTKPRGMGMGLSISRSIIEAHEGTLRATANRDGGSTFRFLLPAAEGGDDLDE